MKQKPRRESPIQSYIDHRLRRRVYAAAKTPPKLSVSKIIEECVEKHLPEIEQRKGMNPQKVA